MSAALRSTTEPYVSKRLQLPRPLGGDTAGTAPLDRLFNQELILVVEKPFLTLP